MTKTEYAQYIQSEWWQQRRKQAIAAADNECQRCWLPRWLASLVYDQDLHVHHLNYQNLGNEQPGDLKVLCRRCHEIETFGRSDFREIKKRGCSVCSGEHFDIYSDLCTTCRSIVQEEYGWSLYWALGFSYDGKYLWEYALDYVIRTLYEDNRGYDLGEFLSIVSDSLLRAQEHLESNNLVEQTGEVPA
jgi:hypothetical protein